MSNLKVFLVVLICSSGYALAAPSSSRSDILVNDFTNTPTTEHATRRPSGVFRDPGLLPCPDQSQMTKMRDLARLENHSKDCRPSTGGAILTDPDRPDGEARDSEVPAQFR